MTSTIASTADVFDLQRRPGVRAEILNTWLVLLLLVGAIVVVTDGLARDPVLDDGAETPTPVLEYESFGAAYLFAFITLPICLLYAMKAGASREEALLLWFLLGTVTYSKDFAYIRVPGVPLFVTDIILGAFLWSLWRRMRLRWLPSDQWWSRWIALFLAVGLFSVLRAITSRQDTLLVFRDFAIVAYSLFVFVGFYVVKDWDAVRRVFLIFCVATLLATLNGFAWFLAQPDQRRFIPFGVFILASFVGVVVFTMNHMIKPAFGWPLAGFLGLGILLTNARTIFVALAATLMITALAGPSGRLRLSTRSLRLIAAVAVVTLSLLWGASQTSAGSRFIDRVATELQSGTLDYAQDPNATFRFFAWMEALRRFSDHPIVGEGYGVPFTFEFADFDPRPHNTYLTVLYKMGVVGMIPLGLVLVLFQWKGWRVLRASTGNRAALFLYALLLGQFVMSVFGLLNLLLESPFLASIYWIVFGTGVRIMTLLDQNIQRQRSLVV